MVAVRSRVNFALMFIYLPPIRFSKQVTETILSVTNYFTGGNTVPRRGSVLQDKSSAPTLGVPVEYLASSGEDGLEDWRELMLVASS